MSELSPFQASVLWSLVEFVKPVSVKMLTAIVNNKDNGKRKETQIHAILKILENRGYVRKSKQSSFSERKVYRYLPTQDGREEIVFYGKNDRYP